MFTEEVYVAGVIVAAGVVPVGQLCRGDALPPTGRPDTLPAVVFVADAAQARALAAAGLPDIAGLVLGGELPDLAHLATQRQIPTLQLKDGRVMGGWPIPTRVRLTCQGDEGWLILLGQAPAGQPGAAPGGGGGRAPTAGPAGASPPRPRRTR